MITCRSGRKNTSPDIRLQSVSIVAVALVAVSIVAVSYVTITGVATHATSIHTIHSAIIAIPIHAISISVGYSCNTAIGEVRSMTLHVLWWDMGYCRLLLICIPVKGKGTLMHARTHARSSTKLH